MADPQAADLIEFLRKQRQARTFTDQPVAGDQMDAIIEVARWTGSAKNIQPWTLVVVKDPERKRRLADVGQYTDFLANAPAVIVPVMDGDVPGLHGYDEGRLSERIFLAAQALGLGAGVAWFGGETAQQRAREILGVPAGKSVFSAIGIGHPAPATQERARRPNPRKPVSELVRTETFGTD
jgi:nitroreductase